MTEIKYPLSEDIYGIETEYSVTASFPGEESCELVGYCHSKDVDTQLFTEPDAHVLRRVNEDTIESTCQKIGLYRNTLGMLSNGARFYIDLSGPEYATAESTTAEEATIRSFDGDVFLYRFFRTLQNDGILESFQINRRGTDHTRTSRGTHINTATLLNKNLSKQSIITLAGINAVKGALFGSGGLLLNRSGDTEFYHSPRLALTNSLSSDIWSDRPLVRTPLKEDIGVNRLETIASDSLNLAWPLRASMVYTNTVTQLLELGLEKDIPRLYNPVHAAKIVAKHGYERKIDLRTNTDQKKSIYPHGLVRTVAELALNAHERSFFLSEESEQVLGEIIETADLLDEKNIHKAMTRVESLFRRYYFELKMEQRKVAINSEIICRADYAWDKVGGGIAETMRNNKKISWEGFRTIPESHRAIKRLLNPPRETRAALRAKAISNDYGVNGSSWTVLELDGSYYELSPRDTDASSGRKMRQADIDDVIYSEPSSDI